MVKLICATNSDIISRDFSKRSYNYFPIINFLFQTQYKLVLALELIVRHCVQCLQCISIHIQQHSMFHIQKYTFINDTNNVNCDRAYKYHVRTYVLFWRSVSVLIKFDQKYICPGLNSNQNDGQELISSFFQMRPWLIIMVWV